MIHVLSGIKAGRAGGRNGARGGRGVPAIDLKAQEEGMSTKDGGDCTDSLTGVWSGLYSYPALLAPVSFVATLIESGAALTGATHETCETAPGEMRTLFATLDGARAGQAVTFTKEYDGSGGWRHAVYYEGKLSADGCEIEGRWSVPRAMTGKFLMIRNGAKARALTHEVFEKV